MAGFTDQDVGACNCLCTALPCNIPSSPLSIAITYHSHGGLPNTYNGTLGFTACSWSNNCDCAAPLPFLFTIAASGGGAWKYSYTFNVTSTCNCVSGVVKATYDTTAGSTCNLGTGCTFVLTSSSCSPFQLVFTWTNTTVPTTFHVITITP